MLDKEIIKPSKNFGEIIAEIWNDDQFRSMEEELAKIWEKNTLRRRLPSNDYV